MPGRHQPSPTVQRRCVVISLRLYGFARVQAHSHLEAVNLSPIRGGQGTLGGQGRLHGIASRVKGRQHTVAGGDHDLPSVRGDDGLQDSVVPGQRGMHRPGKALPPLGAAFDVRIEHRDERRRLLLHKAAPSPLLEAYRYLSQAAAP